LHTPIDCIKRIVFDPVVLTALHKPIEYIAQIIITYKPVIFFGEFCNVCTKIAFMFFVPHTEMVNVVPKQMRQRVPKEVTI
jgi:hypothetical protein